MEKIFKRKIYGQMLEWKNNRKGKTALMIEGARRVGKSTIVTLFAKQEYESFILIDFNKASEKIKSLFNDLMNLDFIFLQLQANYSVVLKPRKSVIIFDEVQKCPMARQAIKYLIEDGRFDYIETGSLISIKKNTKDITIPSEEERINMYPLDYEEFRWALSDENTIPLLKTFLENRLPLGSAFRDMMRNFRIYMLVGGMPQAVNEYLETNNLSKVDQVKRGIIQLYADDFNKLDESGRLEKMFLSIPSQLGKNSSRYKPFQVLGQVEDNKMTELLKNLEDSKTVLFAHHSSDPNVGLSLTKNLSRFKIFTADTGIFITLAFWDKSYTDNIIYNKLLSDKLETNLGYVYENVVAQIFATNGNKLFYYTFPKDEKHNYEVDFILSKGNKIHPVEVKSSGYAAHTSLDAFCKKYSSRIDQPYLLYTKDLKKNEDILMLPVFMAGLL